MRSRIGTFSLKLSLVSLLFLSLISAGAPPTTMVEVQVEFIGIGPATRPASTQPGNIRIEFLAKPTEPFRTRCLVAGHDIQLTGKLRTETQGKYSLDIAVSDQQESSIAPAAYNTIALKTHLIVAPSQPTALSKLSDGKEFRDTIIVTLVER